MFPLSPPPGPGLALAGPADQREGAAAGVPTGCSEREPQAEEDAPQVLPHGARAEGDEVRDKIRCCFISFPRVKLRFYFISFLIVAVHT